MLNFRQKILQSTKQFSAGCLHSWKQPVGHDTTVKIFNCVANTQVPLIVGNKHLVSWYTCGPTVYDDAHIGHASCYMRLDILQRILRKQFGLNVVSTMNITDIDDRIILKSNIDKVPAEIISREYEKKFWKDMEALKIPRPDNVLRVTENMDLIVDFISKLLDDSMAYKGSDGSVYFDVKKFEDSNKNNKYGKLQNIARKSQEDKKMQNEKKIKKNIEDFALWKVSRQGEPKWEAKFGPGRPGWHVECSSLASSFYGTPIDIHAGGIDLRFPHHENEEAQSCAYHNCNQWVNYWLHVGHLHLPLAAKMSKSLKNTVPISELLTTCDANMFRMACLLTNYKNNMEFSEENLKLASTHVKTLKNFSQNISNFVLHDAGRVDVNVDYLCVQLAKTIEAVNSCLCKDFDTAGSIKSIEGLISDCNKVIHGSASSVATETISKHNSLAALLAIVNYIREMCNTFGLLIVEEVQTSTDDGRINDVMDILVNFRHQLRILSVVRKDKEGLELCDNVREECKKLGISLKDNAKMSTWNK